MSVDVRGHDMELDVHGVFNDGRGTCSRSRSYTSSVDVHLTAFNGGSCSRFVMEVVAHLIAVLDDFGDG